MQFGFALDWWNRDLWDIDLLNTDLHLLVGRGLIQIFQWTFCLSSRRLQDVFSGTIFRLPRRLQDVFPRRLSSKKKNCSTEDVLKTSSRRLEDQEMFAGMFAFYFMFTFCFKFLQTSLITK